MLWWREPAQQSRVPPAPLRPWGQSCLWRIVNWHRSGSCPISTCPECCGCLLLRQPDALMEECNWPGKAPREPVSREPSWCSGAAFLVEEARGEQGCWARHVRAVSLFNYRLKWACPEETKIYRAQLFLYPCLNRPITLTLKKGPHFSVSFSWRECIWQAALELYCSWELLTNKSWMKYPARDGYEEKLCNEIRRNTSPEVLPQRWGGFCQPSSLLSKWIWSHICQD